MSSCAEDTRIDTAKRQAIESAATDFVQRLLSPNPSSAFDVLTHEGKGNATPEQLSTQAAVIKRFEPTNVTLRHTYLIELKGDSPGRVVCATDLTKPDGWESLTAASVPEQAHVVLSADTRNNHLAFTLWLIPEQGAWKVHSFWMNIASLAGRDSMQLLQFAHVQQGRGHLFNAALLYAAAAQTANRGPNFQMGITQAISEDTSTLKAPPEVQGAPPFLWKNGDVTYRVLSVGPIAVGGKIYVIMVHEVSPWQSEEEVDKWNKELLKFFKYRFPEYSDAFAGLVARAVERGSNRGFGTVEELPSGK